MILREIVQARLGALRHGWTPDRILIPVSRADEWVCAVASMFPCGGDTIFGMEIELADVPAPVCRARRIPGFAK